MFSRRDSDWLEWRQANKSWLASEFLHRVDSEETLQDFFGSWYNIQGHKQCGYFLGFEPWLRAEELDDLLD